VAAGGRRRLSQAPPGLPRGGDTGCGQDHLCTGRRPSTARRSSGRSWWVAPTEHLKIQWARAADLFDIDITDSFGRGTGLSADFQGLAVTYAGVAAATHALRTLVESRRKLVILDEIHHAGDAMSWGESVQEAFTPATRRLSLTGTPFRSDINPIPFVRYRRGSDGILRSEPDFSYSYGAALADEAVRPVLFLAYSGRMTWRTRVGDEVTAELGIAQAKEVTAAAWRTALDPAGAWVTSVLKSADRRLSEIRRNIPDAGGLVIASDHESARAYAARLRELTGQQPVVVLSDDPRASERIESFAASGQRWLVAVRMVSEGVDIPRLMVGVYATSTSTPLFFAQAVGRFVRARRKGETASVFLPSVPVLLGHAAALEAERDHVLRPPDEEDWEAERPVADEVTEDQLPGFQPLASEATLDRVLFDGDEFGGGIMPESDDEHDFLGIPGLLSPAEVAELLRSRRADGAKSAAASPGSTAATRTEDLKAQRRELNACARALAAQRGTSVATVHAEARRNCGGPAAGQATSAQIAARIDYLRRTAVTG
jgi:superfamily II DNA or RNA helicase